MLHALVNSVWISCIDQDQERCSLLPWCLELSRFLSLLCEAAFSLYILTHYSVCVSVSVSVSVRDLYIVSESICYLCITRSGSR